MKRFPGRLSIPPIAKFDWWHDHFELQKTTNQGVAYIINKHLDMSGNWHTYSSFIPEHTRSGGVEHPINGYTQIFYRGNWKPEIERDQKFGAIECCPVSRWPFLRTLRSSWSDSWCNFIQQYRYGYLIYLRGSLSWHFICMHTNAIIIKISSERYLTFRIVRHDMKLYVLDTYW